VDEGPSRSFVHSHELRLDQCELSDAASLRPKPTNTHPAARFSVRMKVGFARSCLARTLIATSTILPPRFGQVSKMQLAPQLTNGIRLLHRPADGILVAIALAAISSRHSRPGDDLEYQQDARGQDSCRANRPHLPGGHAAALMSCALNYLGELSAAGLASRRLGLSPPKGLRPRRYAASSYGFAGRAHPKTQSRSRPMKLE